MRSVQLHATLLALVLFALGAGSVFWQVMVRDIPLTESETDPVWIVDARMEFDARKGFPVKAQMFVPPSADFVTLNESFVSNNYGVNVNKIGDNRQGDEQEKKKRQRCNIEFGHWPVELVTG